MANKIALLCCCKKCDKKDEVHGDAHQGTLPVATDPIDISSEHNAIQSMLPTGCNTGNPRNKVALSPGHSLMNWIRLGNSGADLTGVDGRLLTVTHSDLADHSQPHNAWIVIRGQVFNIAPYLNFHPGGVDELMRGAGKEATKLFNSVHPWVNYEKILQKCLVGRLVKSSAATEDDLTKAFFSVLAPPPVGKPVPMTWQQTTHNLAVRVQTKTSRMHVLVHRQDQYNQVRIVVRTESSLSAFTFRPLAPLVWPCIICAEPSHLQVKFTKEEDRCWQDFDVDVGACDSSELETYHSAEIVSVENVTHNCKLWRLRLRDDAMLFVPEGHHVRLSCEIEGVQVARRYTPTCAPCRRPPQLPCLTFLIKCYPDGQLTPHLHRYNIGQTVQVGWPAGQFDISNLDDIDILYLVAAGTGITPMTRLIARALSRKDNISAVKLLFINKSEQDIIWKEELDKLVLDDSRFSVEYGLSEGGDDWTGWRGRLSNEHLSNFIPFHDASSANAFLCICGPTSFNHFVRGVVDKEGWADKSYIFDG